MAQRGVNRLKPVSVPRIKSPGYHADGNGLYLQVSPSGSKSWVYRFMVAGRAREMGLGSLLNISLAEARERATEARKLAKAGIDPIEGAKAAESARILAAATSRTFKDCAEQYIKAHRAGWKSEKHAAQWSATLETYAYPIIGNLPVGAVDTGLILQVLEPIWKTKTETASRVRGRVESVLSWATVRGFRSGENPATWRGHLDNLLAEPRKVTKVKHHPALPYGDIAAFLPEIRNASGISARALEFLILTATRTGEIIGADWSEVDLKARAWTIPGSRMKGGREHRVPLSVQAIDILNAMKAYRQSDYIFPGQRTGKPLSSMALLEVLRGIGRGDITAHGFRSTFRDWAAEQTNFPREVVEMALAHSIVNKTEAAYRRGELFEKRAKLMQAWADYCDKQPGKVVQLRAGKRRGA